MLANGPQSPQQPFFALERNFGFNLSQIRLIIETHGVGSEVLVACTSLSSGQRGSFLRVV